MVVFFDRREKKQFFQGKQMFFSEFFCTRHNIFQPEGYIFLGFHPLTSYKPLHFDRFCFILPLQIFANHLAVRPAPRGAAVDPKGARPFGHNVTTFKITKKISPFLHCWQLTYSSSSLLLVQKICHRLFEPVTTEGSKLIITFYLPEPQIEQTYWD
jgi:hypothetical protein